MKKLIGKLYRYLFLKKHKYPASTLIHRRKATIVFEIEFNWYDESLQPVSLVREVHSGKIYSIRSDEMMEFREFIGPDPNAGTSL